MSHKKEMILKLAKEIKQKYPEYQVYISNSKSPLLCWGFYTDGNRVVSFELDFFKYTFLGNYHSKNGTGNGWRMEHGLSYEEMLECDPPNWATGGQAMTMKKPSEYMRNQKYIEVN